MRLSIRIASPARAGGIIDAFDRARVQPDARYVTNSVGMLKYLAMTGAAVTFLSRIDVDEDLREGRLRWVPILGQEWRSHELRLAHRKGSALSPAVALFEEVLRHALMRIAQGTWRQQGTSGQTGGISQDHEIGATPPWPDPEGHVA